jgi:hypothetical protein
LKKDFRFKLIQVSFVFLTIKRINQSEMSKFHSSVSNYSNAAAAALKFANLFPNMTPSALAALSSLSNNPFSIESLIGSTNSATTKGEQHQRQSSESFNDSEYRNVQSPRQLKKKYDEIINESDSENDDHDRNDTTSPTNSIKNMSNNHNSIYNNNSLINSRNFAALQQQAAVAAAVASAHSGGTPQDIYGKY